MKKSIVSLMVVSLLSGCVSADYTKALDKSEKLREKIETYTVFDDTKKVGYIAAPPVDLTPLKVESKIEWLNTEVSINVTDVQISALLEKVLSDTNVSIVFEADAKANAKVDLRFTGKRSDALQAIAKHADYKIKTEKEKVVISAFESESFAITMPNGVYTYQLGDTGEKDDSKGETGESPSNGQYVSVSSSTDLFTEIETGIISIIGEFGSVKVIPSLSMVNVRTTPSRMDQVRSFVSAYEKELSRQVIVDVQVLEFSSNLGKEQGVDWNLVKAVGDGTLNFFIPSTNTISQGAGYGMSFTGKGDWDGTTALIKALSKQGTVATQTPVTGLMLNNQPASIAQTVSQPFLSEVSSDSQDGVVSADVKRDTLTTGVDMMIVPNVRDDFVWLRISGVLSKATNDTHEEVADVKLRFIDTQKSKFNFANKLRYGQTYVIASVKQQKTQADKLEHFGISFLGGTGAINSTTETLVLLTPRKAE
ncbi:hypothetical protein ACTTZI_004172 [Vibrio vulnificus]